MIATYGMSSYKEDKDVLGEKIKAEYDVDSIGAQVMTGYKMGGITPEVGMRYVTMKMDEYTDSIGQNVKPEDVTVLTGVLGVTFKQDFKACPVVSRSVWKRISPPLMISAAMMENPLSASATARAMKWLAKIWISSGLKPVLR